MPVKCGGRAQPQRKKPPLEGGAVEGWQLPTTTSGELLMPLGNTWKSFELEELA